MKKFALLAAVAALTAACSQEAEEAEATDEAVAEAPAATETAPMSAAEMAGTYDVKMADGTTGVSTLNADGTYVDTDASGAETERGTWAMKDNKTCFDPDGEAPETCFTDGPPAADGSWTSTADDGTTVTVSRRGSAAPAAAATPTT